MKIELIIYYRLYRQTALYLEIKWSISYTTPELFLFGSFWKSFHFFVQLFFVGPNQNINRKTPTIKLKRRHFRHVGKNCRLLVHVDVNFEKGDDVVAVRRFEFVEERCYSTAWLAPCGMKEDNCFAACCWQGRLELLQRCYFVVHFRQYIPYLLNTI